MMKKLIFILWLYCGCSLHGFAQTSDERIAGAMNNSDWFALDSLYQTEPKDSISEFLEIFSRCLIGNRFNRPDVSIPAFTELLNTQSENLDLGNLLNSSMMFAMDLSRAGDNKTAAKMLSSTLGSVRTHLDSATIAGVQQYINQCEALSGYNPYKVTFENSSGTVPFEVVPVGPQKSNSVLMHLRNTSINGVEADVTFDTGAGVNVISDSLAFKYNLIPLEASSTLGGFGIQNGGYAIAKELKIGDIIVTDVPFYVVSMTTHNEEADKYADCFSIVVGSELMLQLKDLTIDFVNHEITVPSVAPKRSQEAPNMCFSSHMNLLGKGVVQRTQMLMNIDTGDASYGSLGYEFFENNKEYIASNCELDTIRTAGFGGVQISECYRVPNIPIGFGDEQVVVPEMVVEIQNSPDAIVEYECNLGLKSLMLFNRVRFNMVDFIFTTF
ncbi:MAG: retroviral-like aspartic protease family protein [Bacteroidaceae bacterium]|nr:retroviral-like aspartic protease family protein [Bacteroidaceae bacterium]